ncbi:MAG: DUF4124 domain-containing protein [Methylotenera sp.]
MPKKLLVLLLFFLAMAALGASIYKWVDEQGKTVYSDKPPHGKTAHPVYIPPQPPKVDLEHAQQELERQREKLRVNREQKENVPAPLSDENTRKLSGLVQEYGPIWAVELDLEQQCREKYGLNCDSLLNWKELAIKECKRVRDVDCDDENYLYKFKPITIDAQREGAIKMRARERARQQRSIGQ